MGSSTTTPVVTSAIGHWHLGPTNIYGTSSWKRLARTKEKSPLVIPVRKLPHFETGLARRAPSAPLRRSIGAAGLETLLRNSQRRSQTFVFAFQQYLAGPSGPPWYPPPYWFYPTPTHPQQSSSLGTSTEPSSGCGRGASRKNGRVKGGERGRSASVNGPHTKQQERAQTLRSVGQRNRDSG